MNPVQTRDVESPGPLGSKVIRKEAELVDIQTGVLGLLEMFKVRNGRFLFSFRSCVKHQTKTFLVLNGGTPPSKENMYSAVNTHVLSLLFKICN